MVAAVKLAAEHKMASHKSLVTDLSWSPRDGHLLASSSQDGTVKVWDLRSSVPLHTTTSHQEAVLAVQCAATHGAQSLACSL